MDRCTFFKDGGNIAAQSTTYCKTSKIKITGSTYRLLSACLCYDTIRYDSVYLTCSKKLMGSQLSLPHGTNKKLKCKTKK